MHRYTTDIRPCYGENTPFPWCERVGGARPAQGSAPGRRQGTTGTMVRQVWKNNGSAVETEPHGETSTMGVQKTRDINGLARAALEREGEVREYRVRIRDLGQFPAYMHKEAAGGGASAGLAAKILQGTAAILRRTGPILQSIAA